MQMKHAIIMGAGPAGLAAGYVLSKEGYRVTVVEKESLIGGISKTVVEKGYRFDLGGHRFFTKIAEVEDLWFEVLKDDFLKRPRLSRIYYRNKFFDYPLKPFNALFSMGIMESLLIVASYFKAQVNPVRPEESFEDWVSNRFGKRLYRHFFKSYTEKVWGIPCTELKAEWAAQRIKGLSLISAVFNAIFSGRKKNKIKTLIEEFNYPRLGPGMMYEAMAERICAMGGTVLREHTVTGIHREEKKVTAISVKDNSGRAREITGDFFISSLPLKNLISMISPLPPEDVTGAAELLKYRDFLCVNLALNRVTPFPDNWIYIHAPEAKLGRVQNFRRWSPEMVPEAGCSSLGLEYFCHEGDELWQTDNRELINFATEEITKIGLIKKEWVKWGTVVRVPKAYPVYDDDYLKSLPVVKEFLYGWENLQTIGRNGLHRYNNMDHSMLTGILAAKNIRGENFDLWSVNTDEEYHEEAKKP